MLVQFPRNEGQVEGIRRPVSVNLVDDRFEDEVPQKVDHAAEPIKDINDIVRAQNYFLSNGRYRDNLLFTVGINTGLRCGDLVKLKVGHLLNEDGTSYRDRVTVQEEKTSKLRMLYLNEAIFDAADLYFAHTTSVSLNDYLFQCESNRAKGSHLTVRSVERILKEVINDALGLTIQASTHCLRKTFAYHVITNAPDRSRAIEFLQKILGHSRASITLRYAGITDDEIEQTYRNLKLGSKNPFGFTFKNNKNEIAS